MRDRIGLVLSIIACLLVLYIVGNARPVGPHLIEPFIAGSPGVSGTGLSKPPASIKCTKMSLNASPGSSLSASGGQTWLCSSRTDAAKLIKGDINPYLARNDLVCVDQEGDQKFYTCLDLNVPIDDDDTPELEYSDYDTACKNYEKKYYDLSGALTTLMAMRDSIRSNSSLLGSSFTTLDTMYTKYACDSVTEPTKKIICNAITQTRFLISQNKDKATKLEDLLMPAIQPALDSRAGLITTLREYKCKFKLPS
jgi:hypothetical protein